MMYTIRIIRSVDEFTALEATWSNLLSHSPSNNYFLTWEWLRNWWQIFAQPGDQLMILLVEKGTEIVGIAPFYVRKKLLGGIYPVKRLMFLGTQEDEDGDVGSDYMDVLYREGEEKNVVNALFGSIVSHNICDEIYLSKMDTAAKTFRLVQEEAETRRFLTMIADEFVSPYIKLPSTWEDYLDDLTPSMRYKIRNERRKLQKCGNISMTAAKSDEELSQGFEELARLHNNRWASKGMQGAFAHERFARFHQVIMPVMLKNGHLELMLLSENGTGRAVLYNIVYKNKIYFYQSGIDTGDKKAAFGYVLHSHCIEEAIKKGMTEYDFLPKGPGDDYKDRFSTQKRNLADIYMACQWAVKQIVRAEESARFVYRRIKPHFMKANE